LRDPATGSLFHSPFMSGSVAIIFKTASIMGIAYGIGADTINSNNDVMKGMGKSNETMGTYIVLVFCCSVCGLFPLD
jgi:aminobenzoyl-glutamate transport protein